MSTPAERLAELAAKIEDYGHELRIFSDDAEAIRAALSELQQLRADRDRLDWLLNDCASRHSLFNPQRVSAAEGRWYESGRTKRESIDAAREDRT